MIQPAKTFIARHWPVMRLRTVLFGTLLFVAALPGISAIFLRVYENALVRRTEAELIAQSAALAAAAAIVWPGREIAAASPEATSGEPPLLPVIEYQQTEVDLRSSPILPPRPMAVPALQKPDLAAMATADQLLPAFRETRMATFSSIIMLDDRGTVLTGSETGLSLAALPELRSALAGDPMTLLRTNEEYGRDYPFEWLSRASNIRLHHARPVTVDGDVKAVILVSRSPRALFRGMYEDRGKIALGIAGIFLMLILLSAVLARAIVRPVENLSKATRALASGKTAHLVRPSLQVVEIRDLIGDFEVMAQSIDKRSRYLRDFASSVSHEFKTPLAGISGAIELLQDHAGDMTEADRARFLANMAVDAERLSRLVRRLMELAQADLQLDSVDGSSDLMPIVAAVVDGFSREDFTIQADIPASIASLWIGGDALEAVLVMLIENARQAGAGHLALTASSEGDRIHIDLLDDGPGVPGGDRDRIFDPFFTSKRAEGGTGLGLSIARSLLEAHRGTLDLLPSEKGAHFRICLLTAFAA